MIEPELIFDEPSHTYTVTHADGRIVTLPSVTQIVRQFVPGWRVADWYLTRGKAVHRAVELHATGKLDWSTVHPEIEPRVRAAITACEQLGIKANSALTESRQWSKQHQFAGTIDWLGYSAKHGTLLVDWKSSVDPAANQPQMGAYAILYGGNLSAVIVELRDDGTPKFYWMTAREVRTASHIFLHMRSVYGHLQEHGKI